MGSHEYGDCLSPSFTRFMTDQATLAYKYSLNGGSCEIIGVCCAYSKKISFDPWNTSWVAMDMIRSISIPATQHSLPNESHL